MAAENFKVKKGLEVGTAITATSSGVNVTGIVTATQFVGDGSGLTGVVGSGSGVIVKDEGSAVGTAGTINFVGSGVAASLSAGTATVTINAGSMDDVVDDTTPQLGGNLDLNGKFVNGTGGANITGVVTATGADINGNIDVDGRADLDDVVVAGVTTFSDNIHVQSSDDTLALFESTDALAQIQFKDNSSNANLPTIGIQANSFYFNNMGSTSLRIAPGKVGVNEAAPECTFHVNQNNSHSSTYYLDSQAGVLVENINGGSNKKAVLKLIGNSAIVYGNNGSGTLTFAQRQKETASFDTNGNFSINYDLDVDGQTDLDDLVVSGVGTFSTRIDTNGVSLGTNNNTFAAKFVDNAVANFGTDNDLQIYHTGGSGYIKDTLTTGQLNINSNELRIKNAADNETMARFLENGAAELWCDNVKKFETRAGGATVSGTINATGGSFTGNLRFSNNVGTLFGASDELQVFHSSGTSYISHNGSGQLQLRAKHTEHGIKIFPDGAVELYHDNAKKLETSSSGATVTGTLTATAFSGDGSALTGVTASGTGIIVRHDGNVVGTASSINFSTNLDVSAISAGIVTVTASGSSGVSLSGSTNNTVATVTGSNALIGEAKLTFDGNTLAIAAGSDEKIQMFGTNPFIRFKEGSTDKAVLQWHSDGHIRLINQEDSSQLRIKDDIQFSLDSSTFHKVWHAGNDGASSGLDADLLDGQEGSYYTNATNLGSGTIPNGRFPATLPAVSGANLTALNASEITSGTLPIARIADDAVTFAKMQNVGTGVIIGRNDAGTGDIETLSAADVRTLINVENGATADQTAAEIRTLVESASDSNVFTDADHSKLDGIAAGATVGITTSPDNVVGTWSVTANGSSAYRFTGPGQSGNEDDPDIYLVRGQRYSFINTTGSSHPFRFRVSSGGSTYSDGVSGSENGTQYFNVQHDAPASLVYQCTIHSGMVGNIYIVGQHLANGANNRVLTATSAYGMNGESGLTFDGNILEVNHSGGGNGVAINGISGQDVGVIRQKADNHHAIILRGSSNADGSTITSGNTTEFREYGHFVFKTGTGTMAERIRITNSEMKFTVNQTFNANNTYYIGDNATKPARIYSNIFVMREGTGNSVASGGQTAEVIKFDNSGITMLHDSVTLTTASAFSAMTCNRAGALLRMRNNTGPSIYSENGGITSASASDYRIKENIVGITSAMSSVKKLNPVSYNIKKSWNPNDKGDRIQGFIAHEVQEVITDNAGIICGEKDAVNPDGSVDAQGIDYAKLTPVLTAAVKELIAEVETLKAEVAALKSS